MKSSTTQVKAIQYGFIAVSFIALFSRIFIDTEFIENQKEMLKIIGFGGLAIANFVRFKHEDSNPKSKKFSLLLIGILGSIAIGEAILLFYPALKHLL